MGYTVYAGSVAGCMMLNFHALQSMNKFYIYPTEITKVLQILASIYWYLECFFFLTYDAVQPDKMLQTFRRDLQMHLAKFPLW